MDIGIFGGKIIHASYGIETFAIYCSHDWPGHGCKESGGENRQKPSRERNIVQH